MTELQTELEVANTAWAKWFDDLSVERQECQLLGLLSLELKRQDAGAVRPGAVERARNALREFYRELGMHQ